MNSTKLDNLYEAIEDKKNLDHLEIFTKTGKPIPKLCGEFRRLTMYTVKERFKLET